MEISEGDKGMKKINPEPDKVNLLEVLEGTLAGSTEGCGHKFKVTTRSTMFLTAFCCLVAGKGGLRR